MIGVHHLHVDLRPVEGRRRALASNARAEAADAALGVLRHQRERTVTAAVTVDAFDIALYCQSHQFRISWRCYH